MRDYELTFVVRPDVDDKATKAAADRVEGLITQRGGSLTNVQQWGKRRLAYRIQHHAEGTYYVYRLQMEPEPAAEIEHELNLDEQILRFIMVYLEPKALEALKNPPPPMAPRPERRPMAPPAEGVAAPTEGVAAPAEGVAAPAEGAAAPAEGGAAPVEGGAAPVEGAATEAPAETPAEATAEAPAEGAAAEAPAEPPAAEETPAAEA